MDFVTGSAYGRIATANNAFVLQGDDNDFSGDAWTAGFITARNGGLWFLCQSDNQYVGVHVVVSAEPVSVQSLDDWQQVVECSYVFGAEPYFVVPLSAQGHRIDVALQDVYLDAGYTRVRAYKRLAAEADAKGVDVNDEPSDDPADMAEQFRIELWPADHSAGDTTDVSPNIQVLKGE